MSGSKSIKAAAKKTVARGEGTEEAVESAAAAVAKPTEAEIMPPVSREHEQPSALAPANNDSREAVLSIVGGVTTDQLKAALTVQTEQRKLIKEFIQENLENGIDYGKIHVVKSCPDEQRKAGSCGKDYHYSKSILMKPGQEKIFSLFGITDEIEKDKDAYEMLEGVAGLVAYKCIMYRGDKRIGEGRGAAVLGNERSDPNSTIKKAEKRARMDACLSLGFSAYFTQDLDDPDYQAQREMMNSKAAAEAERRDKDDLGLWKRPAAEPIDDAERKKLFIMAKAAGYELPDAMLELLKANGIVDPKTMTSGQARDFMRQLRDGKYEPVAVRAAEADHPGETPPAAPAVPEPELVVDDDFKLHVTDQYSSLGLNPRGDMWFKQRVLGRPFGDWPKYTDKEWRAAYFAIQGILEGRMEVADDYIAGFMGNGDEGDGPQGDA